MILFVIMLILMGKGFTVTRGRISTGGNIKVVCFTCVYIAGTVAMFVWEAVVSFFKIGHLAILLSLRFAGVVGAMRSSLTTVTCHQLDSNPGSYDREASALPQSYPTIPNSNHFLSSDNSQYFDDEFCPTKR